MRYAIILCLLIASLSVDASANDASHETLHKLTETQAKALVMAALMPSERRLPKVEADAELGGVGNDRYWSFTVVWDNTGGGSVIVGLFDVDAYTADVFNLGPICNERENLDLKRLQATMRARLRLTNEDYRRLKSDDPSCIK